MQDPQLKLRDKIDTDFELLFDLQSGGLLTSEEREEIRDHFTKSKRADRLLSHLAEKSYSDVLKFLSILKNSYQEHVVRFIEQKDAGEYAEYPYFIP
jgi:Caspase recruitment domain